MKRLREIESETGTALVWSTSCIYRTRSRSLASFMVLEYLPGMHLVLYTLIPF
jgi:hypothetical protein